VLTFAVFNRAKGWRHLRWDLTVIGLVQLRPWRMGCTPCSSCGLSPWFSRSTVFASSRHQTCRLTIFASPGRPTTVVLDRPSLLGARAPVAGPERIDSIFKSMGGTDVSSRPQFWQPYEQSKAARWRAPSVATLLANYPSQCRRDTPANLPT
jgi:hypothetical protein